MDAPTCPEMCGPMRRDSRPMSLTYKEHSLEAMMPGWYCECCDQSIHTGEDMKYSDRTLNRLKARAEGLLEPEDIRRIRKRIGLTQAAAGDLIGGGPRAFQKYESGDLLPSRAISSALLLLDQQPNLILCLKGSKRNVSPTKGSFKA